MLRFPIMTLLVGLTAVSSVAVAKDKMHNFPTLTRVEYVMECMQSYERPRQELIYKCSCAIDSIAKKIDHDQWVSLYTFNKAAPIAGERGAYLRERKDIRTQIKSYRTVQADARKACFLPEPKER